MSLLHALGWLALAALVVLALIGAVFAAFYIACEIDHRRMLREMARSAKQSTR